MIALAIVIVNFIILILVSFLISSQIDKYLSKNQTKEKQINIQDKKTFLSNIMNSIFLAGLAVMLAAPFLYIGDLVFRLLFPLPIEETSTELFAIVYINILYLIYFVTLISAWKWLKKYFPLSDWRRKNEERKDGHS